MPSHTPKPIFILPSRPQHWPSPSQGDVATSSTCSSPDSHPDNLDSEAETDGPSSPETMSTPGSSTLEFETTYTEWSSCREEDERKAQAFADQCKSEFAEIIAILTEDPPTRTWTDPCTRTFESTSTVNATWPQNSLGLYTEDSNLPLGASSEEAPRFMSDEDLIAIIDSKGTILDPDEYRQLMSYGLRF
ncbi:hypothetical protein BV25DRAFT_1840553 [Artomyces pyxidatus]|uniref:Uncharacterized protein n=1 Tax=Artomyces pyxidatus TaxID=48021 RepID=A0ACB8SS75_9AGAM|nr:hypothetical protein BV25DRAFT_1840553 [Artomyces pyxidatus]